MRGAAGTAVRSIERSHTSALSLPSASSSGSSACGGRSCSPGSGIGHGLGNRASENVGDLTYLDHELIELLGVERLFAVAECAIGIGMHFDDQPIGAYCDRRTR